MTQRVGNSWLQRRKVTAPPVPTRAVLRPRLVEALTQSDSTGPNGSGWGDSVLLVCAPAGYGKTTMLSAMAEQERAAGRPAAWVTCERRDDPLSFWIAVSAALEDAAARAGVGATLLDLPAAVPDPSFVGQLVEALAQELPDGLLVLDDVHEIQDRALLDGLQQLVLGADDRVRIALGCRFEPPIDLYRLRLSGRLHEVRARTLAFTPDEANEFWDRQGIHLAAKDRNTLQDLTEGWPAGLRLAALSLHHDDNPARFVAEFSGADRPVADYLAGEVLVRMPEDVAGFLQDTCVVEDLPVDLAIRLTGRADSATVLDDLDSRNALVARVDRAGTWYRYHALLRSYLAAASRRRDPARFTMLQATAAQWFLENGDPARAIDLATAAADTDLVETILTAEGLGLVLAGSTAPISRAITFVLASSPRSPAALAYRSILAVDAGDRAAADEALTVLRTVPDDSLDHRLAAMRKAAALHRARLAVDLPVAHASELMEDVGPTHLPMDLDPDVRLVVLADRGALRLFEGDAVGARADLEMAIALAADSGFHALQLYCENILAGTYVAQNDLIGARSAAKKALAFATDRGWDRTPGMAYSYVIAGWTAFQTLHPEEAASWSAIAIDVIDSTVDVEVEGAARIGEAIIAFDEPAQRPTALKRLERTTSWLAERGASRALTALAVPHELRMCLSMGEWRLAEQALERAEKRLGAGGDLAVLHAHFSAARGRPADAIKFLKPVLSGELMPTRSTELTSAWLLHAVLAERGGRPVAATEALIEALATAVPTGAIRPFLDVGAQGHLLLASLRGRAGKLESDLETVLGGIERVLGWQTSTAIAHAPLPAGTAPVGGWLTERELIVLRELPSMMTLGEIAQAQGITINTIKTHVRSIYAKLGATTRREAIGRARGLGLL